MWTGISRTKAGVNFRVSGLIASSEKVADLAVANADLEEAVDLGVGVVSEEGLEVDDAKLHRRATDNRARCLAHSKAQGRLQHR